MIGNPGRGLSALQLPFRRHAAGFATPNASTPSSSATTSAFADNWFFSANYTLSRLYGNYSGLASSDEVTTPTSG